MRHLAGCFKDWLLDQVDRGKAWADEQLDRFEAWLKRQILGPDQGE
jgi:hypothetical protein